MPVNGLTASGRLGSLESTRREEEAAAETERPLTGDAATADMLAELQIVIESERGKLSMVGRHGFLALCSRRCAMQCGV